MRKFNKDPFENFDKKLEKNRQSSEVPLESFDKQAKKMTGGVCLMAIGVMVLNILFVLGLFSGGCWIVKYFFFS